MTAPPSAVEEAVERLRAMTGPGYFGSDVALVLDALADATARAERLEEALVKIRDAEPEYASFGALRMIAGKAVKLFSSAALTSAGRDEEKT